MKYELVLESAKQYESRKHEIYKIGRYAVEVVDYLDNTFFIKIHREIVEYLPNIYCRDDSEMRVLGFDIQTTSYGALSADEIQKMIEGYNEAIEVVSVLTKRFVR